MRDAVDSCSGPQRGTAGPAAVGEGCSLFMKRATEKGADSRVGHREEHLVWRTADGGSRSMERGQSVEQATEEQ